SAVRPRAALRRRAPGRARRADRQARRRPEEVVGMALPGRRRRAGSEGGPADGVRDPEPDTEAPATAEERRPGWSGTRLVALIAAVAVVSLLIGVAVMQFIVSPAELAARTAAPEPGPVTAPI